MSAAFESFDVRLARIEERQEALVETVERNHAETTEHRKRQGAQLAEVTKALNEWSGVRKTLAALGAILLAIGGVIGYATHLVLKFWNSGHSPIP